MKTTSISQLTDNLQHQILLLIERVTNLEEQLKRHDAATNLLYQHLNYHGTNN